MMYGAELWAVKKAQEKKLDVVEMGMLGGGGAGRKTVLLIFQPSHFIVYVL